MQKDKVRIYQLARELNLESKDLLELCQKHGMDLKNQLSCVDAEQRLKIEQLVKRGTTPATAAPAIAPTRSVLPEVTRPIRNLDTSRTVVRAPATAAPVVVPHTATTTGVPSTEEIVKAVAAEKAETVSTTPAATLQAGPMPAEATTPETRAQAPGLPPRLEEKDKIPASTPPTVAAESKPVEAPKSAESIPTGKSPRVEETSHPPTVLAEKPRPALPPSYHPHSPVPDLREKIRTLTGRSGPVRDLGSPPKAPTRPDTGATPTAAPAAPAAKTATPGTVRPVTPPPPRPGTPAPLRPVGGPVPPPAFKKPLTSKPTTKAPDRGPKVIGEFTPEMLEQMQRQRPTTRDLLRPITETAPVVIEDDEEEGEGRRREKKSSGKQVGDRLKRRELREARAQERKLRGDVATVVTQEVELEERVRTPGRVKVKVKRDRPQPRKDKVVIEPPITVRSLSEALGKKAGELLMKLMSHGLKSVTINSTITPEMAEELAIEAGLELEIKKPADAEDQLLAALNKPDNPEDLQPRAPVVTIMGHVDHGKTSLLDRIRQSNVVATEAGGITQVLRAWRVEHKGKPITFLDTPGHEAFTKMRARGAQVTDIAVIVVAANDGVMPQTEEAISHARAAKVSLIIAINKVDLPDANVERTRRQLYNLEILPDNMGGDTPFVETSAVTGKGIDELLETISLVAELRELKANPNKPARGTCLEASLSEGEGVRATFLVQEGTLHRGDVVSCGCCYGRVRQMYNDLGQPIEAAGPSVPVRITGLDEVPNADDPFVVVPELSLAREIAAERKARLHTQAQAPRQAFDLMSKLTEAKIAELKIILKADLRGSIEAIRKELEKLKHEEVAVRVLHAAVGGITESDVQLALTSPQDTMIIGFNAVPDERARALAEERGIPIRQYDIIYNLTDDIKAALEGKLKPREEVVHLGRAVVRETFKISRVGTIAGCYVTQGVIRRAAKVRLIRDGVVIYPPPDRTASLDSLKRFKEDVSEVREGFECGMKISGYDDVKVGDVIEAYRVEEVQRTL